MALQFRKFVEEANPIQLPGRQIELAVAACYWSSLHYIDATLAFPEVNEHPDSDGLRRKIMSRLGHLSSVIEHHRYLNDRYYDAMYRGQTVTDHDYRDEVFDSYREVVAKTERILRGKRYL